MNSYKIFERATVDLLPAEELRLRLREKKSLRIKYGIDPTAGNLHLGHLVFLRRLKMLQDCGHQIICIIGDFTALIGDPSERDITRPVLPETSVIKNSRHCCQQILRILEPAKTEIRYNSSWFHEMKGREILDLTSQATVARMLERDDFARRFQTNQSISIHEFIYPLLQGYDSVMVQADVEFGGSDQKFNLLMGRHLQKIYGEKQQIIITLPLIEGLDGQRKMSKSYGNTIDLNAPPNEIYGKIMSLNDDLIWKYLTMLSSFSSDEIAKRRCQVETKNLNPMEVKLELAQDIVATLHSDDDAKKSALYFNEVVREKRVPKDLEKVKFKILTESIEIRELLKELGLVKSLSAAGRLIDQGAILVNNQRLSEKSLLLFPNQNYLIRCGKKHLFRLELIT